MARSRLIIEKGDTLSRVIDWDNPGGSAVNLTGYTVTCTIEVGETIHTLTSGSGLTVDAAQGRITLTLTAAQTNEYDSQYGTWRLRVTSGSGVKTTLAEGLVFVSES